MKELVINGKTYAKYEMDGDLLYLKMEIEIIESKESELEDFLIMIISHIEKRNFRAAGYLNIS